MPRPDINVTPLIDVLLVLLIIFMVVTPVKPGKFEARLPSEPTPTTAIPDPRTLVVELDPSGSLSLNTQKLADLSSSEPLTETLRRVFAEREANLETEKTVYIKAPKVTSYGDVSKVIDAVKLSGAKPISLQLDRLD